MKYTKHIPYISTIIFIAVFALSSVYTDMTYIFGIICIFLYTLIHGYIWGQAWDPRQNPLIQFLFGTLLLILTTPIIATTIYWFFGWSNILMSVIIAITSIISIYLVMNNKKPHLYTSLNLHLPQKIDLQKLIWGIAPILGSLLLLAVLYTKQYGDTLYSPWTLVGPKFFIIFAMTTMLYLFVALRKKTYPILLFLGNIIHYLLMLSVVVILYKNGYGYDPVIHQASETYIKDHGMILPKNPYYLGQYMLVLFLSTISHISITLIDTLLVPILASIYIPLFIWQTYGYKYRAVFVCLLLPLIPLSWFIFTTPFNLTLLFSTLTALWIWHTWKKHTRRDDLLILLFVIMTLITHAIAGIPLTIILIAWRIQHSRKIKTYLYPLYGIILAITLPLGLILYMNSELRMIMPWTEWQVFTSLFTRPHWEWFDKAPLNLQILYTYKATIPYLVLITMSIGLYCSHKKEKILFFVMTSLGLFVSGAIMATMIRFPDIAHYEYGNYAKRLIFMAYVFLIPAFVYAMTLFYTYLKKQKNITQCISIILITLVLITSWFFTYPTRNKLSYYTGVSIRDADIEAVHFIHERNNNQPDYIVVTNQMVSIAAMKEFGFLKYYNADDKEQYFYSIPTGAPLYQYFAHMVYDEPKREWMLQAMDYAGVDKAYFVHTSYWAPAAQIRDEAKKEANAWWTIGHEEVWIYEYIR